MKYILNDALVRELATELERVSPSFPAKTFIARATTGLDGLELTARASHIADAFYEYLPKPFAHAAATLIATLGAEVPATGEAGLAALRYLPYVTFVQKYGLGDFDAAISMQAELTKRFTAEFSIRAFLERYPERTYTQMLLWAQDGNAHLRRLASEGLRPRLPWAPRLRQYQQDPKPVLAVLELLKDDPVQYVQRSVANNLNDIGKDHPALVLKTCERWAQHAPAGRLWTVRHALRSLVKAGNSEAIRILGGEATPLVSVVNASISPGSVAMGASVRLSFAVQSLAPTPQHVLVDYAVHFVKANGSTRPKVFKVQTVTLQPGETRVLSKTLSFAAMTTRRHYTGQHRVDVLINGSSHTIGVFDVVGASTAPEVKAL